MSQAIKDLARGLREAVERTHRQHEYTFEIGTDALLTILDALDWQKVRVGQLKEVLEGIKNGDPAPSPIVRRLIEKALDAAEKY